MSKYGNFIETLKQLYMDKKIPISKIQTMLAEKNISQEEYSYITAK